MPFNAYVGNPGAGKSHGVVEHVILPALKAGRCVVTNVPMRREVVEAEFPGVDLRGFDVDKYQDLRRKYENIRKDSDLRFEVEKLIQVEIDKDLPPGCVWVVDEAWKLWPASAAGDRMPEPLKEILAMHRHRTNDANQSMVVCLVSQNLQQVSKFARDLVDETYRIRKLGSLGFSKRFMVDVFQGAAVGPNPSKANRLRQIPGKYRAEVWRFYQSHTKAEGKGGAVDESSVDGRGVIWRSPVWAFGVPLVLAGFVFAIWRTWVFFHPEAPTIEDASAREVSSMPVALPRRVMQPGPGRGMDLSAWRIVASLEGGGVDQVWLSDGARWVSLSIAAFCDKDLSGYLVCEWAGVRVCNEVRYLPEVAAVAGVGSVMPRVLGGSTAVEE